MKKLNMLLPVLLCALITLPAAAQQFNLPLSKKTLSKIDADITRAIVKARLTQQNEVKDVCCACGEEIANEAQHCAATDYTGLCSVRKAESVQNTRQVEASVCPQCGHEYTIDEKYHGVAHTCPVKKTTPTRGGNGGEPESEPVFVESGEPAQHSMNGGEPETEYFFIVDENQTQNGGNGGEPNSPSYLEVNQEVLHQAQALLQADRAAHNGQAEHTLGYYYKKVLSEKNANK